MKLQNKPMNLVFRRILIFRSMKKTLMVTLMRCDLRPFLNQNITSLLFTRGFMAPVYHNPGDDAETLNYDKIEKASRLLYLVLTEAGNKN